MNRSLEKALTGARRARVVIRVIQGLVPSLFVAAALLTPQSPLGGQTSEATFTYRLGKDTLAVEQFTRTATRMTGEAFNRQGQAVNRLQYDVAIGPNGRPTMITYRARNAAGAVNPGAPSEVRVTVMGDSVKREAVYADSTNVRMLKALHASPAQNPAWGLLELATTQMRRSKTTTDSIAVIGTGGNVPIVLKLTVGGGDTIRLSNGFTLLADKDGKLLSVDGLSTTQKLLGTRGTARVDVAAMASKAVPTGALSSRGNARASILQGVIFVDYGRPQVRERTVWGGLLVPPDTIWRAGANEATHLATSRELTFGSTVLPAGLYTMFVFNQRSGGPLLVINKQVGQWGTVYDQANDVARIPMVMSQAPEHTEDFTINVKALGGNRGALEMVWGSQIATAAFTVK